jgi:NADH dehydrogenase/putative oxidoreductase
MGSMKAGARILAASIAVVQVVAGSRLELLSPAAGAPLGVSWWLDTLHLVAGSGFGTIVQAACPVLLAVGLGSRPASVALLIQIWLIAMPGGSHDAALFWTALLLRIVVVGPAFYSVDRQLFRGAHGSALPGLAPVTRAFRSLAVLTPAYQLALRVWLAAAPAGAALAAIGATSSMQPGSTSWLPHLPGMMAELAPWALFASAGLLAAGLGTRVVAAALLALVPFGEVGAAGDIRLFWALALAVVAVFGPGQWSLDRLVLLWTRRAAPAPRGGRPLVVVVGAGFGGIAVVRGLRHAACDILLIDRRNHQVFQPLLYQVATASLSPSDIATPVRAMLREQTNVRVMLGEATGVDAAGKAVLLGQTRIAYDWLVLATGARHSYFGHDEWAEFAPGLKSIEDSTAIRRRLLLAFEEAENSTSDDERRRWLTFVIVGGGPTGVELAGAIAELAKSGLTGEFREIDPASARVVLIQAGPRLLPAFPESLSADAARDLQRLGVEVQLDRRVEKVAASGVTVSGELLEARTVLWAAGVMASPAAQWLGVAADKAGRVPAEADLSVAGRPGVFVVGDTARSLGWAGKEVPGLAPAAKQEGAHVARMIRALLSGRARPGPFRYRHFGSLATIGRQSAVADFGFIKLRGAIAWWLWGGAHIAFLVGGRNRVIVLVQWMWAYLTYQRSTRLITGPVEEDPPAIRLVPSTKNGDVALTARHS